MTTVLVVDDEASIVDVVTYALNDAGFATLVARTGPAALEMARTNAVDLVVLDVMLPGIDGFTVCRELRANEATRALPIILLTARETEMDRVVGLELGADDYVVKPFGVRELVARVRALLRRAEGGLNASGSVETTTKVLSSGGLSLDMDLFEAAWNATTIELSRIQFDLLAWFLERPKRVFSREELLEQVWGHTYTGDIRSVDSMIKRLRGRLRDVGVPDGLLVGVRDIGYRIDLSVLQ